MATFDTKTPTYGYGYLILSLDSLISCLFFVFIAKVLSAYAHGIGPMVCTIGIWIALRLMVLAGIEITATCTKRDITIAWAFPGLMAILALAIQISDFLAFAIFYYAPLNSELVEEYMPTGIVFWLWVKTLVLFSFGISKCSQEQEKMEQDRSAYEQLL